MLLNSAKILLVVTILNLIQANLCCQNETTTHAMPFKFILYNDLNINLKIYLIDTNGLSQHSYDILKRRIHTQDSFMNQKWRLTKNDELYAEFELGFGIFKIPNNVYLASMLNNKNKFQHQSINKKNQIIKLNSPFEIKRKIQNLPKIVTRQNQSFVPKHFESTIQLKNSIQNNAVKNLTKPAPRNLSIKNSTTFNFIINNDVNTDLNLEWLNFSGLYKHYATIKSNQVFLQPSYLNHKWRLSDSDKNFVATFELGKGAFKKSSIFYNASSLNKKAKFQDIKTLKLNQTIVHKSVSETKLPEMDINDFLNVNQGPIKMVEEISNTDLAFNKHTKKHYNVLTRTENFINHRSATTVKSQTNKLSNKPQSNQWVKKIINSLHGLMDSYEFTIFNAAGEDLYLYSVDPMNENFKTLKLVISPVMSHTQKSWLGQKWYLNIRDEENAEGIYFRMGYGDFTLPKTVIEVYERLISQSKKKWGDDEFM